MMTPIESIYEIESMYQGLREYLRSKDGNVGKKARKKYEQLVDRFIRENVNFVKPEERYACLHDYEYFLRLMASARDHYYTDNGDSA